MMDRDGQSQHGTQSVTTLLDTNREKHFSADVGDPHFLALFEKINSALKKPYRGALGN